MIVRPALFAGMAGAFTTAFGNVDVIPVVDGVNGASVRGILREVREDDLLADSGQAVEGVTHTLKIDASAVDALVPQRDSVVIGGITYPVRSKTDDGRAMASLLLTGAI